MIGLQVECELRTLGGNESALRNRKWALSVLRHWAFGGPDGAAFLLTKYKKSAPPKTGDADHTVAPMVPLSNRLVDDLRLLYDLEPLINTSTSGTSQRVKSRTE